MGIFDGVLIATDFDGTLFCNGEIKPENLESIRYFNENGGKFTICSGRNYQFLRDFEPKLPINTYTISYNGAYIINIDSGNVLFEGFCDDRLFMIIDKIIESELPYVNITVHIAEEASPIVYSMEEFSAMRDELLQKRIYKVVLRATDPEAAAAGSRTVSEFGFDDYISVRSWNISLELMPKAHAKGAAIKRIKGLLGAKLAVGVGDYENDIELLRDADIGYAVDNACEMLLPYADRVAPNSDGCALAYVIRELEAELKKR